METRQDKLKRSIRKLLIFFIAGLVLSGLTAFPIEWQLRVGVGIINGFEWNNVFTQWLRLTYEGVKSTQATYPFIFYGTDWLAFAHLVIAIAFIGPLRDPVKNIWVVEFGMIASVAVFPLAFIAGAFRGIPWFWRLIDCAFGVAGGITLLVCYSLIRALEKIS
jgi:hypothetical protein